MSEKLTLLDYKERREQAVKDDLHGHEDEASAQAQKKEGSPRGSPMPDTSLEAGEVKEEPKPSHGGGESGKGGESHPDDEMKPAVATRQLQEIITNSTEEEEELCALRREIHRSPQRMPWKLDARAYQELDGYKSSLYPRALFDCRDITECRDFKDENERIAFYVNSFLRHRYVEGRKTQTPDALVQAWNSFVVNYNKGPKQWAERLVKSCERHRQRTLVGHMIAVHQLSRQCVVPCAVGSEYRCPMCLPTSLHMTREEMNTASSKWAPYVTQELRIAVEQLDNYNELLKDREERTGRGTVRPAGAMSTNYEPRSPPRYLGYRGSTSREVPRYPPRADTRASERDTDEYAFDPYDDRDDRQGQQQSIVADQKHPPKVAVEAGITLAELQELRQNLERQTAQVTEQLREQAKLQSTQLSLYQAHMALEAKYQALDAAHRTLQAEQQGLVQSHQTLEDAHQTLVNDHRRVLAILRQHGMGPPSKKSRGSDMDEDDQRKT